jgi:hypothetical protein
MSLVVQKHAQQYKPYNSNAEVKYINLKNVFEQVLAVSSQNIPSIFGYVILAPNVFHRRQAVFLWNCDF